MNKVYRVIWNSCLGLWVVASELTKGKVKSKVSSKDKPKALIHCLSLAISLGITSSSFAVDLNGIWTPGNNNNLSGGYTVNNGNIVDINGPSLIEGGQESGYSALTLQQAIDQGYAVGDSLKGLLYINTGSQSAAITITDPVLGPVTFNVYNNADFTQRAAGSDGTEKVMVLNPKGADFFNRTRFITVGQTGGTANFYSDAKIVGSFKNSQLAYADGRGTQQSVINWTSSNDVFMYTAASISPEALELNRSVDSYAYAGTFNAYDGSSHTVNNLTELQAYNSWLITELQKENGLKTTDYETEFNKARIKSTHDYLVDITKGGEIDSSPYTATAGTRSLIYGIGSNATIRLTKNATIQGYAPSSGIMLAVMGATGVNEGTIDVLGIAMRSMTGAQSVNNGLISVWNPNAVGGTSGNGVGMMGSDAGSQITNNGVINIRPWNNPRNAPLEKNIGIELSNGAAGINNGTINLTATPVQNDSVSATDGVRVGSGATFTNALTGKITVGIDASGNHIHSAPNSIAIDVSTGSGRVENTGEIALGNQASGAFAIRANQAGAVDIINRGMININGNDSQSPVQNVGLYANASSGIVNQGTINLSGVNGVALKAENGGFISSSGEINVKGADAVSGLRNYGGWAQGFGSQLDISGTVNLSGNGAIGLHVRDGSTINLTDQGAVNFISGTNQIGFYVHGVGSAINNTGSSMMNVSTNNSTLFRMADGARFVGTGDSSTDLNAAGKNAIAIVATGKSGSNASDFTSGGMSINLTGEGATGVLIEGGAQGLIESHANIRLHNASAIAGIADGNGHDIASAVTNANDESTRLTAAAQLTSIYDKVTGYIARNGATLNNTGDIVFTGSNTVGIQVQDGSTGENSGSITLQDGGTGLIARSSNRLTTINNTGNLTLKGGSNNNRTTGIQASGSAVTVNMTNGTIDMLGQSAIGVEALDGGTINLAGTALPQFAAESSGITDQIAFRIVGQGSTINTNVQTDTLLDSSGNRSTLFRIEDGASQSGVLQMKTSGSGANGIWATGKNTSVIASSGSDFQILGQGAQGVYISGGASGVLMEGTRVDLVGDGAVVGNVDGNEYHLAGNIVATDTGSTLINQSNISSPLSNATGFIAQNQGLLINQGNLDFTRGVNNLGIKILSGKFDNQASDIKVNGVAIYVEGSDARVNSTGGNIIAVDGEAAIKLGDGASLNLVGSGVGVIEGQGSAHAILLGMGAKGLTINNGLINVNAANASGYGIENQAEIAGIQLKQTVINIANGIGIRTGASLARTNSGTVNIDGNGVGIAFQGLAGAVTVNDLDMSDSHELMINLNGIGGTGVLVNTQDGATVKSGASVNVVRADGGSALVVNNAAAQVIQSGNLVSASLDHNVVDATKVLSFINQGRILASASTAQAMSFDSSVNTQVTNGKNAEIQGIIALNDGDNTFVNQGLINGGVSADNGNNTLLFDDNSRLTGAATLGNGNNQVIFNGNSYVERASAGSGSNTFIIKGTGASYGLLDGGIGGGDDTLVFDHATHTLSQAAKIQNFETVKLINNSLVELNEALVLTDNGAASGRIDIESGSEMALRPAGAGDFLFKPTLTGAGTLSAVLDSAASSFNFSNTVGREFSGTLELGMGTFQLSGLNTQSLTQASLTTNQHNTVTVGLGNQMIGGLTIGGGTLVFGSVMPGDRAALNRIETAVNGTLDIRGTGSIQVTMPLEAINDVPQVDTRQSLVAQDDQQSLVSLIDAKGSVLGTGGQLVLLDENGDVISRAQYFDITQNGRAVALGAYDYQLMSGAQNDGLYIGYGLKQIDLQGTGTNALALSPNTGASGLAADLRAKLTGSGDLAIDAVGQVVSLSNGGNDYLGVTTVRGGTLLMANHHVLGQTANLQMNEGTTLDMAGYSQTVGALNTAAGSSVQLTAGSTLTINETQRSASNHSGGLLNNNTLSGSGQLKVVASELTVQGENQNYIGDVSLSGGSAIVLNGAQGLGYQGVITLTGAQDQLQFAIQPSSGNGSVLTKLLAGNGEVKLTSLTDLTLLGDNSEFSGKFNLERGASLRVSEQRQLGGALIDSDGVTYINASTKWLFANAIEGNGALVKQGPGMLVVNQDLSYRGETTVEHGTLVVGDVTGALSRAAVGTLSASKLINIEPDGVLSGAGNISGAVNNRGAIVSLNAVSGYSTAEISHLNVGTLTNLGVINLAGSRIGNSLTVNGDYHGGGTLVLNSVLGDDNSATDKLIVTGNTSGKTSIQVNNINGSGMQTTANGIQVVNVAGQSNGTFTLNNRAVAGAYEYFLHKNATGMEDGNWYLRSELPTVTPPTENTTPTASEPVYRPEGGSYMANMAAANTLFNLRLEDRQGQNEGSSLWLRQVGSHTNFRDVSGQLKTTMNRYVIQGGGNVYESEVGAQGYASLGVMFGYGKVENQSGSEKSGYSSKGSVDGYNTGLYGTWYQDVKFRNGAYVDSWIQYSGLDAMVSGEMLSGESYNIRGISGSIETGYRMQTYKGLNGDVFIMPQLQAIWSGMDGGTHHESNGTRIESGGNNNLNTRLGLKASREGVSDSDKGKDRLFTVFIEGNWLHNTKLASAVLDGSKIEQSGTRNIGELKLGAEGRLNKELHVWSNVAQQLGDNGYNDTSVVMGIKYRF